MMYANLRGANGQILGSVAIDPTAPGGMQGQLGAAVQAMQAQQSRGVPQGARPLPPAVLPPGGYPGPLQPVSQSTPFVCQLRYMTRAPNGAVTWATRSIPCPTGLPPGIYIHTPGHQR